MSAVKIYGFEGNPRTRAALVVAKYEGVEVEKVEANPTAEGGVGADYLAKFPLGLVPALEKGDFKLTEVIAIATYLAQDNKAGLLCASKEDAADTLRWASWANTDLLPSIGGWVRPLIGAAPYQKPAVEAAKAKALKHLEYFEKTLAIRTFLVGERVTLGDIFVASALVRGFEHVLDAEWRKANPNTVRYWQTVIHQEPFFAVLGKEPILAETAAVYTPPKKETKPKAETPAAAPKKEAKPKAAAPEEEEEEVAEAPKAKHPCEALGKPQSFPLDDWKRAYSNMDTAEAIKWLDEKYPAFTQDYSLWKATYKYNDELTQVFMSSNLIGGLHARLEASRKYLFGSMGVYGKANDSLITGAYLLRGNDAQAVFDVAPDAGSYELTPLDWVKDKEFIVGAWSWEHTVDGKEYADGKVFK